MSYYPTAQEIDTDTVEARLDAMSRDAAEIDHWLCNSPTAAMIVVRLFAASSGETVGVAIELENAFRAELREYVTAQVLKSTTSKTEQRLIQRELDDEFDRLAA
ncbi:hypothetical protein [Chitinimonas lacunae]|uniref:Uncharacterized protein n=1 Tax=Chitinimonas lacunae TaxID=1963018 RepID=A0ABV8MMF7_9NEIS